MRAGPRLKTEPAIDSPSNPTFQATHANRSQIWSLAPVDLHLHAVLVVLPWSEEESSVDERVSVVNGHDLGAHYAGNAVHLVGGVR